MHKQWDVKNKKRRESNVSSLVEKQEGEDFLFLFDLLAHSCGLELTLRVLTHSDEKFYEICKPKFDIKDDLELEEDRLKVVVS